MHIQLRCASREINRKHDFNVPYRLSRKYKWEYVKRAFPPLDCEIENILVKGVCLCLPFSTKLKVLDLSQLCG